MHGDEPRSLRRLVKQSLHWGVATFAAAAAAQGGVTLAGALWKALACTALPGDGTVRKSINKRETRDRA